MKYVEAAHFLSALPRKISCLAALDIGTKHIGVAMTDESRIVTTPFATIERSATNRNSEASISALSKKMQSFVQDTDIDGFIVGLPIFNGNVTPLCDEIVQLMLKTSCHYPKTDPSPQNRKEMMFTLWNENSSSMEARRLSKTISNKNSVYKKHKDEMAAALILQSFLQSQ